MLHETAAATPASHVPSGVAQDRPLMTGTVPYHDRLSEIADRYDGFIVDVWGVIHDGVRLYPGVVDCLRAIADSGKRAVKLTNAPRRGAAITEAMLAMGMPADLSGDVVSSGEAVHQELSSLSHPFYAGLGRRCLHIGPARDDGLHDGVGLEMVGDVADADLILNTGPWEDGETVADYEDLLQEGARLDVPMVCANPDLEVVRGGRRIICAGALALRFEALGGRARWIGKPHPAIYEACFARLAGIDRRRILAIGDSPRTDIAGANGVGVDSALAFSGLHGEALVAGRGGRPDPKRIFAWCDSQGEVPTMALPRLVW